MIRPTTTAGIGPAATPKSVSAVPSKTARGRLVLIRPDGNDGTVFPLETEALDLGRNEGSIVFRDDLFLAPRHLRLERDAKDGRFYLVDLGEPNGVFLLVRQPMELVDGDWIGMGRQLLRFERVENDVVVVYPASERGVRFLGSWFPPAWGRLRQLTDAGTTYDVMHLAWPEVVLGRDQGDIRFPYDDTVAPRHALLRRTSANGAATLADLGGGTFLRVRGRKGLMNGDVIRAGSQTLRIEF